MAVIDPLNDPRPGDLDNNLLRKILSRLGEGAITVSPAVELAPGDVNIGSVTIKDADGLDQVDVEVSAPASNKAGLVTRNIPSGTQTVDGTVAVSNFPASVAVSNFPASVTVSNFPATQPVSGTVAVSNFPVEEGEPLFSAARTGLVEGKAAISFHVQGRRAGFNSTSVLQDVAEFLAAATDALPELTGAETLEVLSSSASDTAAGTGARTIRVTYMNGSDAMVQSADIAMNGVTPVVLPFTARFIYWMEVTTTGTSPVSVGSITLRISPAGATHEFITAGGNHSLSNRFKVPAGYTGYITTWQVSAIGAATQDARLRGTVRTFDRGLNGAYLFMDTAIVNGGTSVEDALPWLVCPPLTRIKVSTISSAAGATNRVDSDFTILLIAN